MGTTRSLTLYKKGKWEQLALYKKEQMVETCSLALYEKSNREQLAPSLFTKRAKRSNSNPCSLQKSEKNKFLPSPKSKRASHIFALFVHRETLSFLIFISHLFYIKRVKRATCSSSLFLLFKKKTGSNLLTHSLQKERNE